MTYIKLSNIEYFSKRDKIKLIKLFCEDIKRNIIPKLKDAMSDMDLEKIYKVKHELEGS